MLPYIKEYGIKQAKTIARLGRVRFTAGGIHSFRLSVKRLRALLALLDTVQGSDYKKTLLKPVRKLYRSAGLLRDIQIHKQLIESVVGLPADEKVRIDGWLKSSEKELRMAFKTQRKLAGIRIEETEKKLKLFFQNLPEQFSASNCMDYVKLKQDQLDLYADRPNRLELHGIRKILKEIVYSLELMNRGGGCAMINTQSCDMLNDIQEGMGRWNDWDNLEQTIAELNSRDFGFPHIAWYSNIVRCELQEKVYKDLGLLRKLTFLE